MQTGWKVEETLVKQLLDYPSIRVKRYDVSPNNGALTLYFSSVSFTEPAIRSQIGYDSNLELPSYIHYLYKENNSDSLSKCRISTESLVANMVCVVLC